MGILSRNKSKDAEATVTDTLSSANKKDGLVATAWSGLKKGVSFVFKTGALALAAHTVVKGGIGVYNNLVQPDKEVAVSVPSDNPYLSDSFDNQQVTKLSRELPDVEATNSSEWSTDIAEQAFN
ncbi:hypothetical protein J6A31_04620 [bacterium]|nr:hypothetical protein [bacterium]